MSARASGRRAVLAAALGHVPFDGWTDRVLAAAAGDLGVTLAEARRLFPGGAAELCAFFVAESDRRMIEALADHDLAALRVRDRIALAVRTRLTQAGPQREAVRRALGFYALPAHAAAGVRTLYRTVDAMWRAAGDTATDFSFYSKRALLAGVYGTTLLFWLEDRSPGCAATWAFLDRRIDDVMAIQRLKGRLGRRLPDPDRVVAGLARRLRPGHATPRRATPRPGRTT
ncbi:MAG: COQ9 family protein [Alphaproteobacteria bacterium]